MTTTTFVPEWGATPAMSELAESRKDFTKYVGSFNGYDITFSVGIGCDVIQVLSRCETMPVPLRDVPMRSIHVVKHNSPVTAAIDGLYEDGNITARVETYVKNGATQQSIRVNGTNGITVEELNQWFDCLAAGQKNDQNLNPVTYQDLPVEAKE